MHHLNVTTQSLISLADELNRSNVELRDTSSTIRGKLVLWFSSLFDIIPEWAARHIEIHKQLETAIKAMREKSKRETVPQYVIEVMDTSRKEVNHIFHSTILPEVSLVNIADQDTSICQMDREEIGEILNKAAGEIPQKMIDQAFQRELKDGNTLEMDLEKTTTPFELDKKYIPEDALKH